VKNSLCVIQALPLLSNANFWHNAAWRTSVGTDSICEVLVADSSTESVRQLVQQASMGDEKAASALMPIVYDELRRLARAYMARERQGQTIQATALVHEAYIRLLKDKKQAWQGRTHFLAIAATSMRQILVERARARGAIKRGGDKVRVTMNEGAVGEADPEVDVLAIDAALTKLAQVDPQLARIVELRFFGGLTIAETAEAEGISPATVKRSWTLAKAWLRREVMEEKSDGT
jgi:RNA polymerase sigma factor (TIGR02999 family)